MTKSLFDFACSNPNIAPQKPKGQTIQTTPPLDNQENIEKAYKHFQNMPKDELLSTLHKEVAKQKANGTFDIQKLETTLNTLDGFLSPEQKKNIKELLKKFV